MKRSIFLLAVSATVLASCSKHPDSPRHAAAVAVDEAAPQAEFGFAPATSNRLYEQPPTPDAPAAQLAEPRAAETTDSNSDPGSAIVPTDAIPVGMPKIAYVYSIGIRIAGAKVQALKQHHADLCEAKGPLTCRIISMNQEGSEGEFGSGSLQLAVASTEARAFTKELATSAEGEDGKQVSSSISGEDLSKAIVDTDARLKARTLLRDRLMQVLATRKGTVTELVEAERGVAQVNEEIDEARSWLTEMKGRVVFSRIDITYRAATAPEHGGFVSPIRAAVGSLGAIIGNILAALIVLAAIGLPALAVFLGGRRLWWRFAMSEDEAEAATA